MRAFTSQKGPGKGLPASGFAPERRESPAFPRAPRSSQPLPSAPALGFNSTLTPPYLSPSLSNPLGSALPTSQTSLDIPHPSPSQPRGLGSTPNVAAAFEHNQLESFALEGVDGLIYLSDAVTGTQTAAVLRELEITLCNDFRAEDVLCLVRACPKVTRLEWQRGRNDDEESEFEWDSDEEATNEAEIRELIVGRGGKCRIDAPHVYS